MNFTLKQLEAIHHHSNNLQLIACAGSGKTEVVAQRVASIPKAGRPKGLAPRNTFAFTYTDRAAAELKDRIILRCRQQLGQITGMAQMYVVTIHAFWYLDEDYDGDCFVDCQMFFDFKKAPNLRVIGVEVEPQEFKLAVTPQPFTIRGYKRIAVKVVDVYGNESTLVKEL